MYLKSFEYLCIAFSFVGVSSQRDWGLNGGYNPGFPDGNSANGKPSSGNSFENKFGNSFRGNKPFRGSGSSAGPWGYESPRQPQEGFYLSENAAYKPQSNVAQISSSNSGSWQSDVFNVRPNQGTSNSVMNSASSSKWSTNSNKFPSNANNNAKSSFWESGMSSGVSSSQSAKPEDWNANVISSNNFNNNLNNNSENKVIIDSDYEDNSVLSSLNSGNNIKIVKPTLSSYGGFKKWETTWEKNNKNTGASKWESNYNSKPQKPSGTNNPNGSLKPGTSKPLSSSNQQSGGKPPTLDTSVLDELDKNDWYFGKESNYPKPPFRSTINIDVSELWNFDNNKKKTNQNSKGSSNNNNNNNKRRNRQTAHSRGVWEGIRCECVNINFCDEKDMIVTQEDVALDLRPLKAFRCEDLTEVCCTHPKTGLRNGANFNEEKVQLQCGQRRTRDNNLFEKFGVIVAQPGEFPWILALENVVDGNCSATLIHHKLALTAAHCTVGALPNQLTLKAGIWNTNDEPPQIRRVTRIIPHPDYNSQNPRNDIALLVVDEPFELTENVNSVCLPVTNDKWDSSQCVVTGWRPKEIDEQVLRVLEKGTVNFLPQGECQNIMLVTDSWRNYILHDSFVCGLEKTGRQSCVGDEGGFVICPSKRQPDTYLQIGIVSKGMNCDNFGRPGIFTNILKFLDWINRNYFELGLFDDIDIRSL